MEELTETGLTDSCFIDTTAVMGTTYSCRHGRQTSAMNPPNQRKSLRCSQYGTGRFFGSMDRPGRQRRYRPDFVGRYPTTVRPHSLPISKVRPPGPFLRDSSAGYVHPPTTGTYVFYIASDNDSRYGSVPMDRRNAAHRICSGATSPRQWINIPQRSAPISLVGGRYIEILHKKARQRSHRCAWSGQGLTDRSSPIYLSPWFVGLYGDATDDQWELKTCRLLPSGSNRTVPPIPPGI